VSQDIKLQVISRGVKMKNHDVSNKEELTPVELIRLALEHKGTPRVPFSLGFGVNLPARLELMKYLGHKNIEQTNDYLLGYDDIRHLSIPYIGPPGRNLTLPSGETVDIWGVHRKPVTYAKDGVYDEISLYPLADVECMSDLDSYDWPSPDWYDYSAIPDILESINPDGKYAVMLGNGNIFETSWYMRGLEQIFMDVLIEPELIGSVFERVTTFWITYFERALSAARGKIDLAFTADDIAGQNGLLVSPEIWKEQIKPWHKKMNARLHEYGVKIIYHTDGAAYSVIDGLIDMGIDAWEAVQLDAKGMDAKAIKEAAGNRLAFHGGISVQKLLPFGSQGEVREKVAELLKIFGSGGGYIAAPSHAVQAGTPPENIVAMLETVRPDKKGENS